MFWDWIFKKNNNLAYDKLGVQNLYEKIFESKQQFKNSFIITGFVPIQKNDKIRNKSEHLTVVFRLDKYKNIIVITAFSETDEK